MPQHAAQCLLAARRLALSLSSPRRRPERAVPPRTGRRSKFWPSRHPRDFVASTTAPTPTTSGSHKQVADLLGVTKPAVQGRINRGRLPATKNGGRFGAAGSARAGEGGAVGHEDEAAETRDAQALTGLGGLRGLSGSATGMLIYDSQNPQSLGATSIPRRTAP